MKMAPIVVGVVAFAATFGLLNLSRFTDDAGTWGMSIFVGLAVGAMVWTGEFTSKP